MGMYTGHQLNFQLHPDTPDEVLDTLCALLEGRAFSAPAHPFFEDDRAPRFFTDHRNGFAFDTEGGLLDQTPEGWRLTHTGACKGSENELMQLADWLLPHLVLTEGTTLGVIAYEENQQAFPDDTDGEESLGYGFPSTTWDASHRALVVRQGVLSKETRRGDVAQVRWDPPLTGVDGDAARGPALATPQPPLEAPGASAGDPPRATAIPGRPRRSPHG